MLAKRLASCAPGALRALLDHLMKSVRFVQVRERPVRGHRDVQEAAQGLPALLHVVDQQPLAWDTVLDLLNMPLEDGERPRLILERSAEGALPDEGVDHAAPL